MGKQNGPKAAKQRQNKAEAVKRGTRKWSNDFYRTNRAQDKPDSQNDQIQRKS